MTSRNRQAAVRPLDAIVADLRAGPSRVWSIVITIFGDAIVPRGGSIWLGTLLSVCEAIGIGPNAVRTAMSRLTADGWLERERVGRNSFYHLTERGRAEFASATHRIYDAVPAAWDGALRLVIAPALPVPAASREALLEAGYGAALPGLWIATEAAELPPAAAGMALLRADASDDVTGDAVSRQLVRQAFPLAASAEAYRRFVASFTPLSRWAGQAGDLDALLARVLLIHQYRRIALRAPRLPAELLPPDWPGQDARRLCAGLYRTLLPGSERWLDREALNETGKLPPPGAELAERFRDAA